MATSPRPRTPSLAQQAGSIASKRVATPDGYAATRTALLALAAQARQQGNPQALQAIRQVMADVRQAVARGQAARTAAARRDKRNPSGTDDITTWYATQLGEHDLVPRSPQQLRREDHQRQLHTTNPERQSVQEQQRQRNLERHAANCLAHALWALHQGQRDWTPLPTSSTNSTKPPVDQPMTRPLGPAYLVVQVPASPFGPPHRLELYRHDYEQLLDLWGYHRVTRAARLAERLRGSGAPREDVDALHALALDSAQHPNLAHAWHAYVTGGRLGDVFQEHSSGTMQRAPRRSGDLGEAVMEVYRQCRAVTLP